MPKPDMREERTTQIIAAAITAFARLGFDKIIDEQLWRFDSTVIPSCFQLFVDGVRSDEEIEGDVKTAVLQKFGLDKTAVGIALNTVAENKKGDD